MKIKTTALIFFGLTLLLAACSGLSRWGSPRLTDPAPNAANGEQIYFTATSQRGGNITYSGGPRFGGGMMGSYLTCSACHGPTAQGGTHRMHMYLMDAPDIRFASLAEEMEEHATGDDLSDLQAFRLAVSQGQHPDGEALSPDMPRWQMSDADLADVLEFLKSLP